MNWKDAILFIVCYFIISWILFIPHDAFSYNVAVDVGHFSEGKGSQGATSISGIPENEYNRKVAEEVKAEIEKRGQFAFLIEDVDLKERAAIANRHADIFISIHHDSVTCKKKKCTASSFSGVSFFISKANPQYQQSLRLSKLMGAEMIKNDFHIALYHKSDKKRMRLLVDKTDGVFRSDKLTVIKETKIPAVLIECGVISNPNEETRLNQPMIREELVRSIVDGIDTFMKKRNTKR